MNEKDINDAVDFIYTHGKKYAEAKAHLSYVEEFRKSKKAMLMKHAMTNGVKTVAAAEIEAYAAMEYIEHLKAIEEATMQAESLRWALVAAQARVDVWRSLEASNRTMDRMG
jgi:hypothetical protein